MQVTLLNIFHGQVLSRLVKLAENNLFWQPTWQHVCLLFTSFVCFKRHGSHVTARWDIKQVPRKLYFLLIFVKMTEQEFIFDPLNKVNHNYGYCMFLGSILSFTLINIVVSRIGPPKSVKGDPWRWNNLFISWIHAAICGTWDLIWFVQTG